MKKDSLPFGMDEVFLDLDVRLLGVVDVKTSLANDDTHVRNFFSSAKCGKLAGVNAIILRLKRANPGLFFVLFSSFSHSNNIYSLNFNKTN